MAVTIQLYDQTAKLMANKELTYTTLKVMLLNNSATFTSSNTLLSDLSANQVSGNGWAVGGETIANVAVTAVGNDAKVDGDDIDKTATGGAIGPAYKAVIYDDTLTSPADGILAFINFGESKQADVGTHFIVSWDATGIFVVTVAAQ